jgi:hypothetical protein
MRQSCPQHSFRLDNSEICRLTWLGPGKVVSADQGMAQRHERRVRDMAGVLKGAFGTLNDLNAPFRTSDYGFTRGNDFSEACLPGPLIINSPTLRNLDRIPKESTEAALRTPRSTLAACPSGQRRSRRVTEAGVH